MSRTLWHYSYDDEMAQAFDGCLQRDFSAIFSSGFDKTFERKNHVDVYCTFAQKNCYKH